MALTFCIYDYFPKINIESIRNRKGEIDVKKLARLAAATSKAKGKRRIMENVCERGIAEEEYPKG